MESSADDFNHAQGNSVPYGHKIHQYLVSQYIRVYIYGINVRE